MNGVENGGKAEEEGQDQDTNEMLTPSGELPQPEDSFHSGQRALSNGNGHAHTRGITGEPSPTASAVDRIKVTASFMKAYTAMRGALGIQNTPLFATTLSGQEDENDSDETKMLNEVSLAIEEDDFDGPNGARPFRNATGRQTTFYFTKPKHRPLASGEGTTSDQEAAIMDHVLDHGDLGQGWAKANGHFSPDDEDSYVSDDEGDPSETRLEPATFRALVTGCPKNNVDDLRMEVPKTRSLRPVTPRDKILNWAGTDRRVTIFERRRQFDMDNGEELSPAYRVAQQGPARSVLWTPPGVTPKRVFVVGGDDDRNHQPMGELFPRMAPLQYRALCRAVFAPDNGEPAKILLSPSSSSSPSSSAPSAVLSPSASPDAPEHNTRKAKKSHTGPRITTFGWSDVHDAVARNQQHHHRHGHGQKDGRGKHTVSLAVHSPSSSSPSSSSASMSAISPSSPILQALQAGWRAVRAKQAEDARLAETNARIQAALTAQARCLAALEHQMAQYNQAREVTRKQEEAERRRARRKQQRIAQAVGTQLQDLQTQVRQAEAAVEQGREWRNVLTRRLRDGEARLERLCRQYGVADVEALSGMLTQEVDKAQTGEAQGRA